MSVRAALIGLAVGVSVCLPPGAARAEFISDPRGDARAGIPPQGLVPIDIASISVFFDEQNFYVAMTFHPDVLIAAPSRMLPNSVIGAIEFDIDRNPATGLRPGLNDVFRPFIEHPLTGLGVDGSVDIFTELLHPGFVDIVRGGRIVATVPIEFTDTSLSLTFSRDAFGGADVVNFAVIVGDFVGPTDAAPGTFGTSSAVPEPATLSLSVVGFAALGIGAFFRRRKQGRERPRCE